MIQGLVKDKGRDDFLFVLPNGSRVTDKMVNAYLQHIGFPRGVGIHKFRHIRGTRLAKEILEKSNFSPRGANKQKEAEEWFKKSVAEKVAGLLGHKKATGEPIWSTSVSAYINPSVTQNFFTALKLRVPSWVPKMKDVASMSDIVTAVLASADLWDLMTVPAEGDWVEVDNDCGDATNAPWSAKVLQANGFNVRVSYDDGEREYAFDPSNLIGVRADDEGNAKWHFSQ